MDPSVDLISPARSDPKVDELINLSSLSPDQQLNLPSHLMDQLSQSPKSQQKKKKSNRTDHKESVFTDNRANKKTPFTML